MQKHVLIIHGCPSDKEKDLDPEARTYDKHWIPWITARLAENGFDVETPLMPTPWKPNYETFKKEFEKYAIGEHSILIGHSCGCAFLVRWLGETKKKIAKLILVAPWNMPDKDTEKAFYNYTINDRIPSHVGSIIMFTSNDEESDGEKNLDTFHKALGGRVIELKSHGHYTLDDMGEEAFPELLEAVLEE